MKEITVGPLTFVGEIAGSHVHVRILGAGAPGHRPLCGSVTVRAAEWDALDTIIGSMLLTAAPQMINNAEIVRLDTDLAKARAAYDALGEELERAIGGDATSLDRLRQLVNERNKARAELAAQKMLFEEQGKSLAAARASVAHLRERVDQYMPIDSVIGDWDWAGIVRDGSTLMIYESAVEAAAKALAHVSAEQMKHREPSVDDETRCAVCAWPLADSVQDGCVRGNCSLRPRPTNLYAPDRAAKEHADVLGGRCGDSSVWKGCARRRGHDGGHSTYDIDAIDKERSRG